jgi:hypothetical protein
MFVFLVSRSLALSTLNLLRKLIFFFEFITQNIYDVNAIYKELSLESLIEFPSEKVQG